MPAPTRSPDPEPVPFFDPTREHAEIADALEAAVLGVVRSGRYALGPEVERFEEEIATYVGVRHAVGVASGTDALLLALRALGIGPGDEVVTTPFSFFATAGAIVHAGARPVFADVRPDTFNLHPEAAAAAVTPRTAALLPVHLFGHMAEMRPLRELAERHGLALVEDAAQAIGARQAKRAAGSVGDAACFSFYPTKNLGGLGDGGLVATDDDEVAARVRRLRVHGRARDDYRHREVGYNSRLDALQAAALRVKLGRLEAWTERRREHARAYTRHLTGVDGLEPPVVRPGNRHVFHQYTVRCRERDVVRGRLEEARIGYGVFYPVPLHRQEALAELGYGEGALPEAERASREALSLPVFAGLTEGERERVLGVLEGVRRG